MPQILEMKEVNGDLWVRIDRHLLEERQLSGMALYTPYEIEQLKRDVALAISDQVLQMFPKPSR